jgi:hypothetical protein
MFCPWFYNILLFFTLVLPISLARAECTSAIKFDDEGTYLGCSAEVDGFMTFTRSWSSTAFGCTNFCSNLEHVSRLINTNDLSTEPINELFEVGHETNGALAGFVRVKLRGLDADGNHISLLAYIYGSFQLCGRGGQAAISRFLTAAWPSVRRAVEDLTQRYGFNFKIQALGLAQGTKLGANPVSGSCSQDSVTATAILCPGKLDARPEFDNDRTYLYDSSSGCYYRRN